MYTCLHSRMRIVCFFWVYLDDHLKWGWQAPTFPLHPIFCKVKGFKRRRTTAKGTDHTWSRWWLCDDDEPESSSAWNRLSALSNRSNTDLLPLFRLQEMGVGCTWYTKCCILERSPWESMQRSIYLSLLWSPYAFRSKIKSRSTLSKRRQFVWVPASIGSSK